MINEDIRKQLADVGLDVSEMISRFMDSEEMFLRFFGRFFDSADDVVRQLGESVAANDAASIERNAHALKGIAGNIGLNGVYVPAQKIVNDIRAGKTDAYAHDYEQLRAAYTTAASIYKNM